VPNRRTEGISRAGAILRPIVFGRPRTKSPRRLRECVEPELVFSVHASGGDLLGFTAIRIGTSASVWGGLSVSDRLTVQDVRTIACAATRQLAAFSIPHGGHHCVLTIPAAASVLERARRREQYREALEELSGSRPFRVLFTHDDDELSPTLARSGFVASAAAATLAAVDHLGLERSEATIGIHKPGKLGLEVIAALMQRGLARVDSRTDSLTTRASVLLVDGPLWRVGVREAHAIRAPIVVALATLVTTDAAERRLHDRRLTLVPDTLTGAGRFLAFDFRSKGLDAGSAVERSFSAVEERARALLTAASRQGEPLLATVRAASAAG
jgi:hypothetical protein